MQAKENAVLFSKIKINNLFDSASEKIYMFSQGKENIYFCFPSKNEYLGLQI